MPKNTGDNANQNLNRLLVQQQNGEHSRSSPQTLEGRGGWGGPEEARTWGLPLGLQNPPKAPKSGTLLAVEPLPTGKQQPVAAAIVAAAKATVDAAAPVADAVVEKR